MTKAKLDMNEHSSSILTERFLQAFLYAHQVHDGLFRRGTFVPSLSHLMAVSSLVLEYGGDEDQAIAGLLHDVIEDGGAEHENKIRDRFGERVARMVLDCTDGTLEQKADQKTASAWRFRKNAYFDRLVNVDDETLLVSCCDKLHNVVSIIRDLRVHGLIVFDRFNGKRDGTLWYYKTASEIFQHRELAPATDLKRVVDKLIKLAL